VPQARWQETGRRPVLPGTLARDGPEACALGKLAKDGPEARPPRQAGKGRAGGPCPR